MTHPNRIRITAAAVSTLVLAAACGSDSGSDAESGAGAVPPSGTGRPVIVDYSPTLSDVPALLFLATHPDVDLLAVTLPGTGEADCEPGVRQTRSLLVIAGQPDIPVGCGTETPMVGDRVWPAEWTTRSNALAGIVMPGVAAEDPVDAEGLLARTLRDSDDPVTIVTLAPLTNLGNMFTADPSLADRVESIVIMGGAIDVPGNVESTPTAEWNLYIDPESVRAVLESGVPVTLVGLDATRAVPGTPRAYVRLADTTVTDTGEAVRQLWDANFDLITSDGWFFWDELAAVVAVDDSVATISERAISIDDDGATIADDDGIVVRVAMTADPSRFEEVFLGVFAGGSLPVLVPLTGAEQQYLDRVSAAMAALDAQIGATFGALEQQVGVTPEDEAMPLFAEALYVGVNAVRADLTALDPPTDFEVPHDELLGLADTLADAEAAFVAAVDANATARPVTEESVWEMFLVAAEESGIASAFDGFEEACGRLEAMAFGRGAVTGICIDG